MWGSWLLFDTYGLVLWGALSDERTSLSFVYAAGPCQIWDFPFRRLLRLAGSRWKYSTPPPHGFWLQLGWCFRYITRGGPNRKHRLQQFSYWCHGGCLAIDWISFPRERVYRPLLRNVCVFIRLLHSKDHTRCLPRGLSPAKGLYATVQCNWQNVVKVLDSWHAATHANCSYSCGKEWASISARFGVLILGTVKRITLWVQSPFACRVICVWRGVRKFLLAYSTSLPIDN
jgi:hypothetical protein